MSEDERVELKLDLKHQTDGAYLVSDGDISCWLPKAAVNYDGDIFCIPVRLAKEKGLI